jgi:small subunit ribosomal protein S17
MTETTEPAENAEASELSEATEATGATGPGEPDEPDERGGTGRTSVRKTREGMVVSDKMDKTVVVAVEDRVKHAVYSKVIRRTSRLKAHDESNEVGVGDRVLIMETRPLSATKRWRVVQVIEKAQ